MTPCVAQERLQLFLDEALDQPAASQVGGHLEECSRCQHEIEDLLKRTAPLALGRRCGPAISMASVAGQEFIRRLRGSPLPSTGEQGVRDTRRQGEEDSSVSFSPCLPVSLSGPPGYEVLEEIGRGGMGIVYKARQLALNRLVALKMLHADCRVRRELRERFQSEAEALARLQHPNIVQVYEVGESEGGPYLALEFVEGGSLARKLDGTPQPAAESARLIEVLARAAHHAHEHGLIHRDLKPANVLLSDQCPKITDFGLVKWLDREQGLSHSGTLLGTPSYMPPEQTGTQPGEAGPAADVYSLGAILYELLTGRPPFKAETAVETALQVLHADPVPPSRLRPNLPRDLETVCLKCLQKDPQQRYATALALAEDLERFREGHTILARPASALERGWRWCRRNPTVAALALTLCLAVVVGTAAVTWKWREAEDLKDDAVADANAKEELRLQAVAEAQEKEAARGQEAAERRRKEAALKAAEQDLYSYAFTLAYREWQANNLRRAREELSACPPAVRHWEWDYLSRLCVPQGYPAFHTNSEQPVAFSPDGRFRASVGREGVEIWNANPLKKVRLLPESVGCFRLCFSPDGNLIAAVCPYSSPAAKRKDRIRVWSVERGEYVPHISDQAGAMHLAFSADGQHLIWYSGARTFSVKDVKTGQVIRNGALSREFTNPATRLSPDGGCLAVADKGRIQVVPIFGEQPIAVPFANLGEVRLLALTCDGRLLAAGGPQQPVRVWKRSASGYELLSTIQATDLTDLQFAPDGGKLYTLGGGRLLQVWDPRQGAHLHDIRHQFEKVLWFTLEPSGTRLAAGMTSEEEFRVLYINPSPYADLVRNFSSCEALSFSQDGSLLAVEAGPAVLSIRDIMKNRERQRFSAAPKRVTGSAFSPDGKMVACETADHAVTVWDLGTGEGGAAFPGSGEPKPEIQRTFYLWLLAFSPDSQHLAISHADGKIKVWPVVPNPDKPLFEVPAARVNGLAFAQDGARMIVTTADARMFQFDAATGKQLSLMKLPRGLFFGHRAISCAKSMFAVGFMSGGIQVFPYPTGGRIPWLDAHRKAVTAVAFSADGRRLFTSSYDQTLKTWDVTTWRELLSLPERAIRICPAPDNSKLLTVGSDNTLKLWRGEMRKP